MVDFNFDHCLAAVSCRLAASCFHCVVPALRCAFRPRCPINPNCSIILTQLLPDIPRTIRCPKTFGLHEVSSQPVQPYSRHWPVSPYSGCCKCLKVPPELHVTSLEPVRPYCIDASPAARCVLHSGARRGRRRGVAVRAADRWRVSLTAKNTHTAGLAIKKLLVLRGPPTADPAAVCDR